MLTLISLAFGLLLVLAVLHTLRRMFSPSMRRGATFVTAITFCVAMGVAFLEPQKIDTFFRSASQFLPAGSTSGDIQFLFIVVAAIGIAITIMLIVGLRRLLGPLLEVNSFVVLVGIVVIAVLAAVPGAQSGVLPGPFEGGIVVFLSFLAFGILMLTHHFLGRSLRS